VVRQFRELFRLARQHSQQVGTHCGVSGAQLWAMAELEACPGLKISELARTLSVHLSTASNLLDRLQAKSLVRRERSERDQRVVRVRLTGAGRKMLRAAPPPLSGVIPDALCHMPGKNLAELSRELAILLDLTHVRDRTAAMKPLGES
jgi:DNA-binding MarR family transcriptional regulator